MLCELSFPVTDPTGGRLDLFLGLMVKCSCLGVLGCCSTEYEICGPLGCFVVLLATRINFFNCPNTVTFQELWPKMIVTQF